MPRPFPGPRIHPEDHNNPTCENFKQNRPVEKRFIISPRLHEQRPLDRAGRGICRIVYAHGLSIQKIAHISCVSEETVRRAIQNKNLFDEAPDTIEKDYFYVNPEYLEQYPPLGSNGGRLMPMHRPRDRNHRSMLVKPAQSKGLASDGPKRGHAATPPVECPTSYESATAEIINILLRDKDKDLQHAKETVSKKSTHISINKSKRPQPPKCNQNGKLDLSSILSIHQFLSNVGGFDLSNWQKDFESKGLSSVKTLAIIAKWQEQKLARSLSKLFPEMPDIHRFALLEALTEMNQKKKLYNEPDEPQFCFKHAETTIHAGQVKGESSPPGTPPFSVQNQDLDDNAPSRLVWHNLGYALPTLANIEIQRELAVIFQVSRVKPTSLDLTSALAGGDAACNARLDYATTKRSKDAHPSRRRRGQLRGSLWHMRRRLRNCLGVDCVGEDFPSSLNADVGGSTAARSSSGYWPRGREPSPRQAGINNMTRLKFNTSFGTATGELRREEILRKDKYSGCSEISVEKLACCI
ncbi:hypothetical protein B0H13DRAFT_1871353 [Mycena leptocephala]|nr:hypothetical protein B0H13DRAFT_1871353 [Mycena leptocephala]